MFLALLSIRTFGFFLGLALTLTSTSAQFVDPNLRSDCSAGIGFLQCLNEEGCCFGAAVCCAGGCCPITAWCVNQGEPNEGCCPLDDPTNCGASISSFSKPPCTAGPSTPKPSVQCVSADDDWYCPPGSVCGLEAPMCHDFFELGCTSEASAADSTITPAPSPSRTGTDRSGGSATEATDVETAGASPSSTGAGIAVKGSEAGVLGLVGLALGLIW